MKIVFKAEKHFRPKLSLDELRVGMVYEIVGVPNEYCGNYRNMFILPVGSGSSVDLLLAANGKIYYKNAFEGGNGEWRFVEIGRAAITVGVE